MSAERYIRDSRHGQLVPQGTVIARLIGGVLPSIEKDAEKQVRAGIVRPNLTHWIDALVNASAPVIIPYWQRGYGQRSQDLLETIRRRTRRKSFLTTASKIRRGFPVGGSVDISHYLKAAVFSFAQSTLDTVANEVGDAVEAVRRELAEASQRGEGQAAINARMRRIFGDPHRADRIGITEAVRAYNAGSYQAAVDSGIVGGMTWLSNQGACFVPGSRVMKVEGNRVTMVAIETIEVGDMVIGKSGAAKAVVAIKATPYRGPIVSGPGFGATPDHRFLTRRGWRPIGQYAVKAEKRRLLDLDVRETQDTPSADAKVLGLPTVFGRHLRLGVPVDSIAEHDQVERVDDEIDNPLLVHRDLLAEPNGGIRENIGHGDFDVRSFRGVRCEVDVRAMTRAEVELLASRSRNGAGQLLEGRAARRADTDDAILPCVVTGADVRELEAGRTAAPRSAFESPGRDAERHTAPFAGSEHGWLGASVAAEPTRAGSRLAGSDRERVPATLAGLDYRGRSWPISDVASLTAVDAAGACLTREGLAASATWYSDAHEGIISSLTLGEKEYNGPVYDIQVEDDHSFVLECGLIAHNCDICTTLEGKTVKLGTPFFIHNDGNPVYRVVLHPPLHPHCRCSLRHEIDVSTPIPGPTETHIEEMARKFREKPFAIKSRNRYPGGFQSDGFYYEANRRRAHPQDPLGGQWDDLSKPWKFWNG